MKTTGRHILVEYFGCNGKTLNDERQVETLLVSAAIAAKATVVGRVFHRFSPQGVSGVVVVEESHLSIHTWPEYGYAAVDFFTCGECTPERAHDVLTKGLEARHTEVMFLMRGMHPQSPSIRLQTHFSESDGDLRFLSPHEPDSMPSFSAELPEDEARRMFRSL